MNLTVIERMGIQGLFEPKGSLASRKLKRDIVEKVGLTADEYVEYKVTEEDGMMKLPKPEDWLKSKEIEEFTGGEASMIVVALEKLVKDDELNDNQLSLYEKFVEKEKGDN